MNSVTDNSLVQRVRQMDLAAAVESDQISPALQKGEPRVKIVVERKGQKIAVEATFKK